MSIAKVKARRHAWAKVDREKVELAEISADELAAEIAVVLGKLKDTGLEEIAKAIDAARYSIAGTQIGRAFEKHARTEPVDDVPAAITQLDASHWYAQQNIHVTTRVESRVRELRAKHPIRSHSACKLQAVREAMLTERRRLNLERRVKRMP